MSASSNICLAIFLNWLRTLPSLESILSLCRNISMNLCYKKKVREVGDEVGRLGDDE